MIHELFPLPDVWDLNSWLHLGDELLVVGSLLLPEERPNLAAEWGPHLLRSELSWVELSNPTEVHAALLPVFHELPMDSFVTPILVHHRHVLVLEECASPYEPVTPMRIGLFDLATRSFQTIDQADNFSIGWNPARAQLAWAAPSQPTNCFDLTRGQRHVGAFPLKRSRALARHPDSAHVLRSDGSTVEWLTAAGELRTQWLLEYPPRNLAFASDDLAGFAMSRDRVTLLWPDGRSQTNVWPGRQLRHFVADRRTAYFEFQGFLEEIDLVTNTVRTRVELGDSLVRAINPAARTAALQRGRADRRLFVVSW